MQLVDATFQLTGAKHGQGVALMDRPAQQGTGRELDLQVSTPLGPPDLTLNGQSRHLVPQATRDQSFLRKDQGPEPLGMDSAIQGKSPVYRQPQNHQQGYQHEQKNQNPPGSFMNEPQLHRQE